MSTDYIIIGAGSAGCALAHELVQGGCSVLLLEAGGWDSSPFIKIASGQPRACVNHDWGYYSQPDPSRGGATERWTRGRVLGGSSSINGTMYVRGTAADFDRWQLPGWSAQDVMPLFEELEYSDQPGARRGHTGPLHVRTVRHPHRITEAFVQAACAAGLPFNPDYNGVSQEGVGFAQLSQRGGWRCSASDAFLKPLLKRANLQLRLNAVVEKIEIVKGRAVSVIFVHNGKKYQEAAAEIIVSAGAINSPKLLMLSGVGRPEELERHGVKVFLDLPGVGRNLKEQPMVFLKYRSRIPTHNPTQGLWQKAAVVGQFLLRGEGPISNLFEATAFLKSSSDQQVPDIQLIFMAFGYLKGPDGRSKLAPYPSFMVLLIKSYPVSEGRIRLASNNPMDAPLIECRLLEAPCDIETLARGIEAARDIIRHPPMAGLIETEEAPGAAITGYPSLLEYVRTHTAISLHPIGTCRMGMDAASVVSPDMRVRGTENLWVADASIMPDHTSPNINAACMMIGLKLGKQLMARS